MVRHFLSGLRARLTRDEGAATAEYAITILAITGAILLT